MQATKAKVGLRVKFPTEYVGRGRYRSFREGTVSRVNGDDTLDVLDDAGRPWRTPTAPVRPIKGGK